MATTLQRDNNQWLLLRQTKDWKKFLVKRISLWNWLFKYVTLK